jgi:uncharacterized protein (DUF111 family)
VRVKLGRFQDAVKVHPEYEDCRAVSRATGLPLAEIARLAIDAAIRSLSA